MALERVFASSLQNFGMDYSQQVEAEPEIQVRDWHTVKVTKDPVTQEVQAEVVAPEESINLFFAEPRELMTYFYNRYKEVHGYAYKFDWTKEFAIMKAFKNRYGPEAGPMIAQLFDNYKGMWGNQVAGISILSTGAKWIQDILYAEVQEAAKAKVKKSTDQVKGMMDSNDFINRFTSA